MNPGPNVSTTQNTTPLLVAPGTQVSSFATYALDSSGNVAGLTTPSGGIIPITANLRNNLVLPKRVKRFGVMTGSTVNFTFAATIRVPFPWLSLKPVIYSPLPGALAGCTASVCVMPDNSGGLGSPTGTLTAITQSASASLAVNAAVSGGNATVPQTAIHGRTPCDTIALPSVARTDGGTGYLLHVRWFVPVGQTTDIRAAGFALPTSTLATDEVECGFFSGADKTLLTGSSFARYDVMPPIAFEFTTEVGVRTVHLAGDSTCMGYGYNDTAGQEQDTSGFQLAIRQLRLAGQPIDYFQTAYGSMKSGDFLTNALNAISTDTVRPNLAGLLVGSVNDTDSLWTSAWSDRCIRDAITWINTVSPLGITPFLRTMNPKNSLTAPQEAFRIQHNARVIALANAAKIPYADPSSVLTAAGGGYKTGYSTDGVHCNATGYGVERDYLATWLATTTF